MSLMSSGLCQTALLWGTVRRRLRWLTLRPTLQSDRAVSWQSGLESRQGRLQAQTLPSFVSGGSQPEQLAWADAPPILCLTPHPTFLSVLGCRSGTWGWNQQWGASCLLPPHGPHSGPCHSVSPAFLFSRHKTISRREHPHLPAPPSSKAIEPVRLPLNCSGGHQSDPHPGPLDLGGNRAISSPGSRPSLL